ncbi:MAG: GTP cyclohydrolase II [Pseudomonadota bacterium]
MTLTLTITERMARALGDLRLGVPVRITGGGATQWIAAVEPLTEGRLGDLRRSGPLTLAMTARRAETLKVRVYDGDLARIAVPEAADAGWLRAVADPAADLMHPMKGPFVAAREGSADVARAAIHLMKAARMLPAVLTVAEGEAAPELTTLSLAELGPELLRLPDLHGVVAARLPMALAEAGRLHVFRPDDGGEEHFAIEVGQPDRAKPVLARLHSACFTGDVLGSLKCDCGPQLRGALAQMNAEGAGVLVYLNQEGRGIGLANKIRAYALQDQGFDTVEANHRLGFEDDERDFRIGAQILRQMGFSSVRLLTNNPRKIDMLRTCGLDVVERVPLHVGETAQNRAYLATKAAKSGHLA